jgi:hypothetical protein
MLFFADDGETLEPIAADEREWALFLIFGLARDQAEHITPDEDWSELVEWWDSHIDWLRPRFDSPDEWLSSGGDCYRAGYNDGGGRPQQIFVAHWQRFKATHAGDTLADIDRLLRTMLHGA